MKVKRVNRYYCDFCKKAGCHGGHIKKHEEHCSLNPDRKCGFCEVSKRTPANLADLIALLPKLTDFPPIQADAGFGETLGQDIPPLKEAIDKAINEVYLLAENCPGCIFAAIRQSGLPTYLFDFDFKKVKSEFWADHNDKEWNAHGPYGNY